MSSPQCHDMMFGAFFTLYSKSLIPWHGWGSVHAEMYSIPTYLQFQKNNISIPIFSLQHPQTKTSQCILIMQHWSTFPFPQLANPFPRCVLVTIVAHFSILTQHSKQQDLVKFMSNRGGLHHIITAFLSDCIPISHSQ